jgi:hypothetical protein
MWPKAARHCDCERRVQGEQGGGLTKHYGTTTDITVPNLLTERGEGGEGKKRKNKRRKSEYDNDDDDERMKNNFEVSRLHQPPHLQTQDVYREKEYLPVSYTVE